MARNQIWQLLKTLDTVAATTIYNGPRRAAERVIRELQDAGPAWSGEFSNSWQLTTPFTTVKGTGSPGAPQRIIAPAFTGRQATSSILRTATLKNKIVFTISNFAKHAEIATDIKPGVFINPGTAPLKPVEKTGKRQKGIRGLLTGTGGNQRTAPLDWFTLYVKAGKLDKAIEIAMRTSD